MVKKEHILKIIYNKKETDMLKHLKTFKAHNQPLHESNNTESVDIETGEYISLEVAENALKIKLVEGKKEKARDEIKNIDEVSFNRLFEDIESNSDFTYSENIGNLGLGLTDAPGFLFSYTMSDEGSFEETTDSVLYYYNEYAINNFVEELFENGVVEFTQA